jgi:uncharacterized membrane protein YjjP (DUF1212 family)
MHVAAILQRQDFILRLARALMMFGAPPHRIETQIQQTAKVLEIECQVIYIVNFMIVSFVDSSSHTSDIRMVKQGAGLDLHRLNEIAILHWEVMHDKIGVAEASEEISNLMTAKPHWNNLTLCFFGACCSACISIAAFNASFIDLLVSAGLGSILVAIQCFITAKSDILSSIFEIIVTTVSPAARDTMTRHTNARIVRSSHLWRQLSPLPRYSAMLLSRQVPSSSSCLGGAYQPQLAVRMSG